MPHTRKFSYQAVGELPKLENLSNEIHMLQTMSVKHGDHHHHLFMDRSEAWLCRDLLSSSPTVSNHEIYLLPSMNSREYPMLVTEFPEVNGRDHSPKP
jgi:hypothetical protein